MRILVTAFDPFGKETINPALEVLKCLPNTIQEAEIIKQEIPTAAYACLDRIKEVLQREHPDMVLSIGQAGGRSDISVERIGININDFRIADNAGNILIDTPIFADGDDAYFVTLPIKAMVKAIRAENIPASISNSAGTFVCNHVTYGVRYLIEKMQLPCKSGFIHIPYLPSQVIDKANMPSMSLDTMVKGVCAAITAMVENEEDIAAGEGSVC